MILIFVYNARSGKLNTLLDSAHKIISPSTYSCRLCMLTHNSVAENKAWKQFRKTSGIKMEFYHIDEFEKNFGNNWTEFPVILQNNNGALEEFLSNTDLQTLNSSEELIGSIIQKAG